MCLVNLYAPNKDSPEFFANIWEKVLSYNNADYIVCGDFNTVRDYSKDTYNYARNNNPKAKDEVERGMALLSLTDEWRALNPESFKFTWWTNHPSKKARLDYFLISQSILSLASDCHIRPRYRSDHAPVVLKLHINNHTPGPGPWRLNVDLLQNEEVIKLVKKEILLIKSTYAVTPYHPDYVDSIPMKDIEFLIDESLIWETLLTQIRGVLIRFASSLKRQRCKREETLSKKIESLENNINTNNSNPNQMTELALANEQLVKLREEKLKGAKIRSRANCVENGEKPSQFFLQLEKSNNVNKCFKELHLDTEEIVTDQERILLEIRKFYKKPLHRKPRNRKLIESLKDLNVTEYKKIPLHMINDLDGPITHEELHHAVINSKNNKSPGPDGFPVEFYKIFWDQIGHLYLRSINLNFNKNKISNSQLQGVITCLPKGNKPRKYLKNWKPISLLNSSYKLISTCIANRV